VRFLARLHVSGSDALTAAWVLAAAEARMDRTVRLP